MSQDEQRLNGLLDYAHTNGNKLFLITIIEAVFDRVGLEVLLATADFDASIKSI
jgi:hypothetical protein